MIGLCVSSVECFNSSVLELKKFWLRYASDAKIVSRLIKNLWSCALISNVSAQEPPKGEKSGCLRCEKHVCVHVHAYLGTWQGSGGRSELQLAIIFGTNGLQSSLQDAGQHLVLWLFFVSQWFNLFYELLDLIYNSGKQHCDVQTLTSSY